MRIGPRRTPATLFRQGFLGDRPWVVHRAELTVREQYDDRQGLGQAFDVIHLLSPSVEPTDIDLGLRHLQMTRSLVIAVSDPRRDGSAARRGLR